MFLIEKYVNFTLDSVQDKEYIGFTLTCAIYPFL